MVAAPRIREATPDETVRFGQRVRGFVDDAVVEVDGRIIGYGALMQFMEVQMETFGSPRDRAAALELLITEAIGRAVQRKDGELHAFTSNPTFAYTLKKHYGFTSDNEIPLTLELR